MEEDLKVGDKVRVLEGLYKSYEDHNREYFKMYRDDTFTVLSVDPETPKDGEYGSYQRQWLYISDGTEESIDKAWLELVE